VLLVEVDLKLEKLTGDAHRTKTHHHTIKSAAKLNFSMDLLKDLFVIV
jgi:hypothetical protein